mmetsp:Transcript_13097/g.36181  ORF Transcript_13097/g.36181 Transcript_13097/m.36181 type:complete len:84 (-) Transcript_13097:1341-1592(-)
MTLKMMEAEGSVLLAHRHSAVGMFAPVRLQATSSIVEHVSIDVAPCNPLMQRGCSTSYIILHTRIELRTTLHNFRSTLEDVTF